LNTILISTYTSSLWIFPSMNKTRLRLLTSFLNKFLIWFWNITGLVEYLIFLGWNMNNGWTLNPNLTKDCKNEDNTW
jgi:hypothetical protein